MIYAVNKRTKEHEVMDPNALYNTAVWEEVHDDPDGWIEWRSGECPLPDSDRVAVRYRSGVEEECECERLRWHHTGCLGDIIAYRPILNDEPAIDVTRIATEPPAWDGDGLPPVGCECEWKHKRATDDQWVPCQIVGYHNEWVFVVDGSNSGMPAVKKVATWRFRPIRSEEDRAIEELEYTLCQKIEYLRGTDMRPLALHLYRAGYRKTGGEG